MRDDDQHGSLVVRHARELSQDCRPESLGVEPRVHALELSHDHGVRFERRSAQPALSPSGFGAVVHATAIDEHADEPRPLASCLRTNRSLELLPRRGERLGNHVVSGIGPDPGCGDPMQQRDVFPNELFEAGAGGGYALSHHEGVAAIHVSVADDPATPWVHVIRLITTASSSASVLRASEMSRHRHEVVRHSCAGDLDTALGGQQCLKEWPDGH